ncbi:nucA [Symbiodinium necroappetens]|uniref:Endonuclease n=1 Tax=Symbiodinium necroappetens TaxID=1628268 RepID=A0A812Z7B4_9DINO|nr:nucA [Symbiodinium necroappetens]
MGQLPQTLPALLGRRFGWRRRVRALAVPLLAALAPATPAAAVELHTPHCLYGCPTTELPASSDVIVRRSYTLASDDATKLAAWVAYRVDPARFGGGRARAWAADPLLAPSETLEPPDYRGAHAALGTDRGHLAPLASFGGDRQWRAVNYLSNILPQASAVNQGPWRALEAAIRDAAEAAPELALYVLTGPLYTRPMAPMPGADESHRVPSGYWKLLAAEADGRLEVRAFLFDRDLPRRAGYCERTVTLAQLEAATGLRFFHGLDARPGLPVSDASALLRGLLGCAES